MRLSRFDGGREGGRGNPVRTLLAIGVVKELQPSIRGLRLVNFSTKVPSVYRQYPNTKHEQSFSPLVEATHTVQFLRFSACVLIITSALIISPYICSPSFSTFTASN